MEAATAHDEQYALALDQLRFGWDPASTLLHIEQLSLQRGQTLLLSGPSGSGKSTLLNLIGGVLQPRSGSIIVAGQTLSSLGARKRDRFRAENLGIIFQQFNLLPFLSVVDNVLLPLQFAPQRRAASGSNPTQRRQRAEYLLDALGLQAEHWQRPSHRLSVGQQQRVAAARALIGAPALLLADEPTSALDPVNRDRFVDLLLAEAKSSACAVLMVSHDPALADRFADQASLLDLGSTAQAA